MKLFTRDVDAEKTAADASARAAASVRQVIGDKLNTDKRIAELNEKIRPLALNVVTLKEAGVPCDVEKEQLRQLKNQRDGIRQRWQDDLAEARRVAETFTRPHIVAFKAWCGQELRRMPIEEKIVKRVQTGISWDSERPVYDVTSNLGALGVVRDILVKAINEVDRHQHGSIDDVNAFIKSVQDEAMAIDLRRTSTVELLGDQARELDEKQPTSNLSPGYCYADHGVIIRNPDGTHAVDSKTADRLIDERIKDIKAKVKGL